MSHHRSCRRTVAILSLGLVLGATFTPCADAADRKVMGEQFTATWCGYCPPVGIAMNMLMDDYPDSIISAQIHVSDAPYNTTWGTARASFYSVSGIPHMKIDGVLTRVGGGTVTSCYNDFLGKMNTRLAVPTDVTIDLTGEIVVDQTYRLTASIGVEAGGAAKTVRVHMIQTLDDYPVSFDDHTYNCTRVGYQVGDYALTPGNTEIIVQDFNLDAISWGDQQNIRFIVFVQEPNASGLSEIYQAADLGWFPTIEHQMVEVTITPEAIADDPTLAGAKTFDLQVIMTEGDDWTSTDATATIDGAFYQHPSFDANTPQPGWWPTFPSLELDSFFSAYDFAAPAFVGTPTITNDSMSAIWFDTENPGSGTYTIARFTVTSGTSLMVTGTSTANYTQGELHPFSFEVEVTFCPGDLDGDGDTDQSDLGILLGAYELTGAGDLDGDGDTDQSDLGILLGDYPCP
ncbi:MAG: hypothetical protein KAS72_01015 [Phycisphaerales bacterium]|nr:hypothetical protein [Phycisphaerales bacterium]